MPLEAALDRLHARVVADPWLRRFTVFTRVLVGVGFIPPGLTKVLGNPFTRLEPDTTIGYFFDALYRSGFYYEFIGWAQVVAGILLLIPRTATLGAVFYFPIILNIWVVTLSMSFQGTWIVTTLMLLAITYLVCWDYDRWKGLVFAPARPYTCAEATPAGRVLAAGACGAVALALLAAAMRLRFEVPVPLPRLVAGLLLAGAALGAAAWAANRRAARRAAGRATG